MTRSIQIKLKGTSVLATLVLVVFTFYICLLPAVHALQTSDMLYEAEKAQFFEAIQPLEHIYKKKHHDSKNNLKIEFNAGAKCVLCVAVVRIAEQLALKEQVPAERALHTLCGNLESGKLRATCDVFVYLFGGAISKYLSDGYQIDQICQKLHLCDGKCVLYKKRSPNQYYLNKAQILESYAKLDASHPHRQPVQWSFNFKDKINEIKAYLFNKLLHPFTDQLPLDDADGDRFSTMFTMRGTAWRGKDCDPKNANIYPGRKDGSKAKAGEDYNCNGIKGINSNTGKAYKDELCPASQPHRGIAVMGDSVGARFRAPETYLKKDLMSMDALKKLAAVIENEGDFPHLSWNTGYDVENTHFQGVIETVKDFDSVYLQMRKRDRCVHRDYQNLAHNGDRSFNMTDHVRNLKRDPVHDNPLLVIVEYVGNDACQDSLSQITSPTDFYNNILKGLKALDQKLPPNSYVLFVGVADGRFLYDALHDKIHPFDVPYPDFYDYLACNNVSPCRTWLNSDKSIRDKTTEMADELSAQYGRIIDEFQTKSRGFKNFTMAYMPNPVIEIMKECANEPNCVPADLIEPVDGFHPGQKMQPRMVKVITKFINQIWPDALGVVNPNNAIIDNLFGKDNQGGY